MGKGKITEIEVEPIGKTVKVPVVAYKAKPAYKSKLMAVGSGLGLVGLLGFLLPLIAPELGNLLTHLIKKHVKDTETATRLVSLSATLIGGLVMYLRFKTKEPVTIRRSKKKGKK